MIAAHNTQIALKIEDYAHQKTKPESELLKNLILETKTNTSAANMLSGRIEGRLLNMLVKISSAKKILEIGTFTGYSALCMAEALPLDGMLTTCEIDDKTAKIAQKYFSLSPHAHKIKLIIGPAMNTIDSLNEQFDLVFIDADKNNYPNYFSAVKPKVKNGGLIIIDNALWGGEVISPKDKRAIAIDNLNETILNDPCVENVLLNIRDGVNVVRKIN